MTPTEGKSVLVCNGLHSNANEVNLEKHTVLLYYKWTVAATRQTDKHKNYKVAKTESKNVKVKYLAELISNAVKL